MSETREIVVWVAYSNTAAAASTDRDCAIDQLARTADVAPSRVVAVRLHVPRLPDAAVRLVLDAGTAGQPIEVHP